MAERIITIDMAPVFLLSQLSMSHRIYLLLKIGKWVASHSSMPASAYNNMSCCLTDVFDRYIRDPSSIGGWGKTSLTYRFLTIWDNGRISFTQQKQAAMDVKTISVHPKDLVEYASRDVDGPSGSIVHGMRRMILNSHQEISIHTSDKKQVIYSWNRFMEKVNLPDLYIEAA